MDFMSICVGKIIAGAEMNETEWEDYCTRAKIPKARRHLYRHIELSKLEIIINTVGSIVKLADALGINRGKVQRWSNRAWDK